MSERELVQIRGGIGMIFSGRRIVRFAQRERKRRVSLSEERQLNEEQINAEIIQLLGFVGLEDAIDKMPGELSGGMKRRLGSPERWSGRLRLCSMTSPPRVWIP